LIWFTGCVRNETTSGLNVAADNDFQAFARINDGSAIQDTIDLDGSWKFKAADENDWMDAVVPGTVHQDLIRAGKLEDPYYRDNELDAQWVEKKEWEYMRTFNVDESFLGKDRILLECRGLDDICDLYLNDVMIASTQNMFIENEFNVKDILKKGTNKLHAVFHPVLEWNRRQADSDPRVTWTARGAVTTDAIKGLLYYSRKEASDFGWDWGIRLLSCGIWKPVRLAAYNSGRITQLGVRQDLQDPDTALLMAEAEAETYGPGNYSVDFDVLLKDSVIARAALELKNGKAMATLRIPHPELWWPNGWGEHPLYTVKTKLKCDGKDVHSRQVRTGLRTIEIEREKDERGESFGIKVNGKLIFCKGANWIPADAIPGLLTEGRYKHLLQSCIDANMNMIRLWGGGVYEPDVFYEFCDEHGLMIWHDFMFASGPYLATEPYLANVRAEIKNIVLRRRHHPSGIMNRNLIWQEDRGGWQTIRQLPGRILTRYFMRQYLKLLLFMILTDHTGPAAPIILWTESRNVRISRQLPEMHIPMKYGEERRGLTHFQRWENTGLWPSSAFSLCLQGQHYITLLIRKTVIFLRLYLIIIT
jgi:beta-mannosidase